MSRYVDIHDIYTYPHPPYLHPQLHAYVRHKLHGFYGDRVMAATGPMPAHLLGNMWAQSWGNIADLVKPYPR